MKAAYRDDFEIEQVPQNGGKVIVGKVNDLMKEKKLNFPRNLDIKTIHLKLRVIFCAPQ